MYRGRAYDFVTVNTNATTDADKVTDFLKSQHASSTNLQVVSADLPSVQTAFGSSWQADEEYTVVIAPGGKIVYAHKGPIDILDVRHAAFPISQTILISRARRSTGLGLPLGRLRR